MLIRIGFAHYHYRSRSPLSHIPSTRPPTMKTMLSVTLGLFVLNTITSNALPVFAGDEIIDDVLDVDPGLAVVGDDGLLDEGLLDEGLRDEGLGASTSSTRSDLTAVSLPSPQASAAGVLSLPASGSESVALALAAAALALNRNGQQHADAAPKKMGQKNPRRRENLRDLPVYVPGEAAPCIELLSAPVRLALARRCAASRAAWRWARRNESVRAAPLITSFPSNQRKASLPLAAAADAPPAPGEELIPTTSPKCLVCS